MDIGTTIRRLRRTKGLTQEDLAAKLGITVQTVSRWGNGVNYPDVTMLPELASLFEVTADHLLGIRKTPKSRKLLKTTEVLELDSREEAEDLVKEFSETDFPKLTAYHMEEQAGKIILTVEKEFGVEISEMNFK